MNIIVCVKRVPDSETRIKISGDGVSIDPAVVKFVLNPYDEFAVEEALGLKERAGAGTVTVMTLGGEEAKETLRTALAMGADTAVLLKGAPSPDGLGQQSQGSRREPPRVSGPCASEDGGNPGAGRRCG